MKQKGFTLIELLVALAIGGVITWGIVVSIHQVVWGTGRTNSQVVALTDVHQAALAIKKDLQMAQSAESADLPLDGTTVTLLPGGPTIKLNWIDYTSFEEEENKNHSSTYDLLDDGKLRRIYDYEKPSETTSIVGRNITSLEFTQNDRVINVVIAATAGDIAPRSETLEFSVYLRGGGIQ